MIKRLIFDIDGTLIRNVNFSEAITKTLNELKIYSKDNYDAFVYGIKTYENNYDNYNKEDYINHFSEQLKTPSNDRFLEILFNNLRFAIPNNNEEVFKTLLYLSKKYELVLLSNYFEESQRNRLKEMGINEFFTEYYGENKIKPYKEAYISACKDKKTEECLIIGDHLELDINIPRKLGINTIWITESNKKIAGIRISKISELIDIL